MINFEQELQDILANDPLGLLDIRPRSAAISADERLINSFREINTFVQTQGREPAESRDIQERRLWSRLKGLRDDPGKAAALQGYDEHGLLADVPLLEDMETPGDILEHDPLGLLGDVEQDPNDIFKLRNVPKSIKSADHVSRRKPCKDFEKYKPLFEACQTELRERTKVLVPFRSERQIQPDRFFVLHGQLVYVESIAEKKKKGEKVNARMHCVFENGTESNMLLRSLSTPLSKDEQGRVVLDASEVLSADYSLISNEDEITGYVYVLRSLSDKPEIAEMVDLYKVGFSTGPVGQRIEKASKEPTYLMADVALVTEFEIRNVPARGVEKLLHRFFGSSCLDLDIYDEKGRRHRPREWFVVPLPAIEEAVRRLLDRSIVDYRYDPERREIVPK